MGWKKLNIYKANLFIITLCLLLLSCNSYYSNSLESLSNAFNQEDLIAMRESRGVFEVRPGITGLAQVQGIDMSTPDLLAETDAKMLNRMSLAAYFKYIFLTLIGKGTGDRVRN